LRVQALGAVEDNVGADQGLRDRVNALAGEAEEAIRSDDDAKITDVQKRLEEAMRELMTAGQQAGAGQTSPKQDDVVDADFTPAE
ncbi:MAG: molecular chaperone DnaK, partial [Deinococcus sp.]